MRDKDGDLLNGSNAYKLHLPAIIPAKLYWAVTIYNPVDGTMPQTGQPFPSRNQFDGSGTEFYDQTWKPDDVVRLGVGGRALQ